VPAGAIPMLTMVLTAAVATQVAVAPHLLGREHVHHGQALVSGVAAREGRKPRATGDGSYSGITSPDPPA
jgi:hypothetical protein